MNQLLADYYFYSTGSFRKDGELLTAEQSRRRHESINVADNRTKNLEAEVGVIREGLGVLSSIPFNKVLEDATKTNINRVQIYGINNFNCERFYWLSNDLCKWWETTIDIF